MSEQNHPAAEAGIAATGNAVFADLDKVQIKDVSFMAMRATNLEGGLRTLANADPDEAYQLVREAILSSAKPGDFRHRSFPETPTEPTTIIVTRPRTLFERLRGEDTRQVFSRFVVGSHVHRTEDSEE